MTEQITAWANRTLPQNFIIRYPLAGSLIEWAFCLAFMWVYEPLNIDPGYFSYEFAIALYSAVVAGSLLFTIRLLKQRSWFKDAGQWNIKKELASILIVMAVAGTAIYFTGFLVEVSSDRWHILMFLDSLLKTFLIGGIPFFFFTTLNIYALLWPTLNPSDTDSNKQPYNDAHIELDTPLKSEELRFFPDEFIYAFSEGNYVIFYLNRSNKLHKEIVRCTISSVEEQLANYPFLLRTHRAYIVNLNKIEHVSGNSLGYRLQLQMTNDEIPVARSRTHTFKRAYRQLA